MCGAGVMKSSRWDRGEMWRVCKYKHMYVCVGGRGAPFTNKGFVSGTGSRHRGKSPPIRTSTRVQSSRYELSSEREFPVESCVCVDSSFLYKINFLVFLFHTFNSSCVQSESFSQEVVETKLGARRGWTCRHESKLILMLLCNFWVWR